MIKMKLKNSKKQTFNLNNNMAQFYGILMGDGCISNYYNSKWKVYEFRIDGNAITDYDYFNKYLVDLIKKITGKSLAIKYRKDCNGIFVRFKFKALAYFFHEELDFPFGKKGEISICQKICQNSTFLKEALIGFFDTDGSLYFTKNDYKKIRSYPIIELSTHSKKLLNQFEKIMSNLGFKYVISHYKDSLRLHGKKNLLRWFRFFGSNHPDKLSKYEFWRKYGYCPKIDEMDYWTRIRHLKGP